jgi:hypothetical protein
VRGSPAGGGVLHDHALPVFGHSAAHACATIGTPDSFGDVIGDAFIGVEVQSAGAFIEQIIQEDLAIQVMHHFAGQVVNDLLRIGVAQQFRHDVRCQFEALIAVAQSGFGGA